MSSLNNIQKFILLFGVFQILLLIMNVQDFYRDIGIVRYSYDSLNLIYTLLILCVIGIYLFKKRTN